MGTQRCRLRTSRERRAVTLLQMLDPLEELLKDEIAWE
jgi:hypothetical protein